MRFGAFFSSQRTDNFDVRQAEPDLTVSSGFMRRGEFSRDRVTAAIERTFRERSLL